MNDDQWMFLIVGLAIGSGLAGLWLLWTATTH